MNENLIRRFYSMSDAELCSFASSLAGIMTRDIADLAPFGITAATIASFKALVDAFVWDYCGNNCVIQGSR